MKEITVAPDVQKPNYMFSGGEPATEWRRLEKQHNGFSRYLGGKLSFAPLNTPKSILELGAGTGEWAVQAARMYPEAKVTAVDKQPLPPRPLPINVYFQKLDLLDDLPWDEEIFDVIHMRLLLYHMPNAARFLHRVTPLLKPGGWLLVEDACLMRCVTSAGPAQQKRNEIMARYMSSKGLDLRSGASVENTLREAGCFSSISSLQVTLPLTQLPDDPSLRDFAEVMKESIIRAGDSINPELVKAGMTSELREAWREEMYDPRYDPTTDFFFVWACKQPEMYDPRYDPTTDFFFVWACKQP